MIQVGQIVVTPDAKWEFSEDFQESCVARHMTEDRGEEHSLKRELSVEGVFASCYSNGQNTLWVLTYPSDQMTLICTQKELERDRK